MITIGILLGAAIASFAWAMLFMLMAAHRAPPLMMHGRRDVLKPGQVLGPYGGQPYTPDPRPPTRRDPPPMPECKPANVGGIRYEHLGMADREDER